MYIGSVGLLNAGVNPPTPGPGLSSILAAAVTVGFLRLRFGGGFFGFSTGTTFICAIFVSMAFFLDDLDLGDGTLVLVALPPIQCASLYAGEHIDLSKSVIGLNVGSVTL